MTNEKPPITISTEVDPDYEDSEKESEDEEIVGDGKTNETESD